MPREGWSALVSGRRLGGEEGTEGLLEGLQGRGPWPWSGKATIADLLGLATAGGGGGAVCGPPPAQDLSISVGSHRAIVKEKKSPWVHLPDANKKVKERQVSWAPLTACPSLGVLMVTEQRVGLVLSALGRTFRSYRPLVCRSEPM